MILDSSAVIAADAAGGSPRNRRKGQLQALLAGLPRSPRQPGDGLQHGLIVDDGPLQPLRGFLAALGAL